MIKDKKILLSFDVEEFDMPLEYGIAIDEAEQMQVGYDGLLRVKELLQQSGINATLFTTANFALHYPAIIKELSANHEIASHTFYHSSFETKHLKESRSTLERITGKPITGLRMPRMRQVTGKDIEAAGYSYDSSINPTWLPGRYNNLHLPRKSFKEDTILRIPASVSTFFRVPLFWLSFKNFPYALYLQLARQALKRDGYLCIYFHPWEFTNLEKYKMPGYTRRPCGEQLLHKITRLINDLKNEAAFTATNALV